MEHLFLLGFLQQVHNSAEFLYLIRPYTRFEAEQVKGL